MIPVNFIKGFHKEQKYWTNKKQAVESESYVLGYKYIISHVCSSVMYGSSTNINISPQSDVISEDYDKHHGT